MAELSRIFIRDLPPGMKEDDFKKHFATPFPITDAKLIPRRRIGYVGYKTHDAAAKAVKHFNKSFIRMSRIGVEIARPVEELKLDKDLKPTAQTTPQSFKRKHQPEPETRTNPKLKEFLHVMAPPSKTKVWSNEDYTQPRDVTEAEQAPLISDEAGQSDAEYEPVPKKRRKSNTSADEPRQMPIPGEETEPQEMEKHGSALEEATNTHHDESQQAQQDTPPTSDADWIRSRTSRLLGLVDDDELDSSQALRTAPDQPTARNEVDRDTNVTVKTSDVGSQTGEDLPEADQIQAAAFAQVESNEGTGRLFLRNLSYETNADDLRSFFESYGNIEEVHIPTDARSGTSKGFAYLKFEDLDAAKNALLAMDGRPFHGRLLHIIPAAAKREHQLDDYEISKLPIKKQKQIKRKAEASVATFKWNSMYMNTDAIMSSIASRLGVSKSDILDPTSADAAVKQAHAETSVIQETKAYFSKHGVDLESFKKHGFSDTVILVKNFPYGTSGEELKQSFEAYGAVKKLLLPPSATIAIVQMEQPAQARSAFAALAYRKFKDSILFLEKAPKEIFDGKVTEIADAPKTDSEGKLSASDLLEQTSPPAGGISSTIFVRNLNFSTTSEQLRDLFRPLNGFLSARVKTKTDPKKPGQVLSMGFGFVEFRSKQDAQAALAAMNGYRLDGHDLLIKQSNKALDAAEERKREDLAKKIAGRRTKIIIKNLPFEAAKKDVRALFGPYGQLRSVRVPKKSDSSTRGFAFADFVTAREAENAMDALNGTHLLGRRLNLDFAAEDAIDPEEEIEKMQKKVGRQTDKVAIQKLKGAGRKKFNIQENVDNID